jgi:hypothetical protein
MPWLAATTLPGLIRGIVADGSRLKRLTGAPLAKACAEAVTTVAYPLVTVAPQAVVHTRYALGHVKQSPNVKEKVVPIVTVLTT